MFNKINMVGKRFGRLIVIKENGTDRWGHPIWECLCDCGEKRIILGKNLRNGRTRSCGCLRQEKKLNRVIHGDGRRVGRAKLYVLWNNMKQRCHNPKNPSYKKYGLKGISVCDEWKNSYQVFKEWALINGYNNCLSIDRENSFGDYAPENCRFITLSENSSNGGINRAKRNKLKYLLGLGYG